MIEYLAFQIIKRNLTYQKVMSKFLTSKQEIDTILISKGKENLIEDIQI